MEKPNFCATLLVGTRSSGAAGLPACGALVWLPSAPAVKTPSRGGRVTACLAVAYARLPAVRLRADGCLSLIQARSVGACVYLNSTICSSAPVCCIRILSPSWSGYIW